MRGFYDSNVSGGGSVDSILADMQEKKRREQEEQRAYYLALMQGQPYERRAEILRANPRARVNVPDFVPTPEEEASRTQAGVQTRTMQSWEQNADPFTKSIAGTTLVTDKVPNKEFTEITANRSYLPEVEFLNGLRIGQGSMMNAKDQATVPAWVDAQGAAAGKDRAEATFTAGAKTTQALAGAGASNADAEESRANAAFTTGPRSAEATSHAGLYDAEAAEKRSKPQQTGPGSEYSRQTQERIKASVDDLIGRVGAGTVGPIGQVLKYIGGTEAKDFAADLSSLQGNVAFMALQEMRAASKTGGALGQVAVRELELLQNSIGALDQGQSPDNMRKNLGKIKDDMIAAIDRWEMAKQSNQSSIGVNPQAASPAVSSFLQRHGIGGR